ncbi:MAG: FHA domain-containing protein [Planctomycetaceae bacterium]
MPITLTVISGPESGRVLELRTGSSARVGRGEDLDFSVPDDPRMSTQHFLIEGRPDCGLLTDLKSTNGTFVNGEPVTEAIVANGDQIVAGQTTFAVTSGAAAKQGSGKPSAPAKRLQVSFAPAAAEVCAGVTLTSEGKSLLNETQSAEQFVGELRKKSLYADALRVLSRAMGTPAALLWSCGCVETALNDRLSDSERSALDAAGKWAMKPSEETAAAAFAASAKLENRGPAAMLAEAAYWGAGNAAPPGHPPIPADEQLPCQAISGALTLVAVDGPPEDAAGKYEDFIEKALAAAEK